MAIINKTKLSAKLPDVEKKITNISKGNVKYSQPPHPSFDRNLYLQRAIGNQALLRLSKPGVIQTKLKISQPGDKYEQEADRVADEVMQMSEPKVQVQPEEEEIQTKSIVEQIIPLIQRKVKGEEEKEWFPVYDVKPTGDSAELEELPIMTKGISNGTHQIKNDLSIRLNRSRNGGEPLPEVDRTFMERRFGTDFSGVRVYADSNSIQMNKELNAKAFTYDSNIYFGPGRYNPSTASARRLLAHELTHVMQQGNGLVEGRTKISAYRDAPYSIIQRKGISFELSDAPVPTKGELKALGLAEDEARVYLWLKAHAEEIREAETRFRVDRRTIAGAIAWEALENVKSFGVRAVGPGKVHIWDFTPGFLGEKETVAEQVEHAGYLPPITEKVRGSILKTATGAIEYIGAIMSAFADEAEKPHASGWSGENIRYRPEILTNAYQSEDLLSWETHLDSKKPGDELKPGNPMALWVKKHLKFLEKAVGIPNFLILQFPAEIYEKVKTSEFILPPEAMKLLKTKKREAKKSKFILSPGRHIVQRGETLSKIAHKYGISVKDLIAANGSKIKIWKTGGKRKIMGFNAGETIIIPKSMKTGAAKSKEKTSEKSVFAGIQEAIAGFIETSAEVIGNINDYMSNIVGEEKKGKTAVEKGELPPLVPISWSIIYKKPAFKKEHGGERLNETLLAKVNSLCNHLLDNHLVRGNIIFSQGVRSRKIAHRWSTAYMLYEYDGPKLLKNLKQLERDKEGYGRDKDENIWYHPDWKWAKIKANALKLWPSMNPADEGYEPGDERRKPNTSPRPKVSLHIGGNAMDVTIPWRYNNPWDPKANKLVKQFDLRRPVSVEPWHFTL